MILIDINKEKSLGEVLDLRHCIEYLNKNIDIKVGNYEDCSNADIVVITAGASPKPGQSKIEALELSKKIVEAYSMGEYGDLQMVPWSNLRIGGKPFKRFLEENEARLGYIDLDKILNDTIKSGWEIFKRKGTTYYGIAASCVGIIKSIINDENRIIPVSTLLDGKYGEYNIFSSVPAIINKNGVNSVVEIDMTEDEIYKFKKSNERIRGNINNIR